jgi:hypothetical protein
LLPQNAFLDVIILLLSRQDFEPDAVLGIDSGKRGTEAIDASLRLFNVIFEEVSVNQHRNCVLMSVAILYQEAYALL